MSQTDVPLVQDLGGVFLLGVLLGSGREFLRGRREAGAGAGD